MNTFPRVRRSRRGYDVDEVEEFLRDARAAYDAEDVDEAGMSAADIRRTAFGLRRGGYATGEVDAALERLEDAFARRERDAERARLGEQAWIARARRDAQVILNRLSRPRGHRFHRTSILSYGYHRAEVDRFTSRLARHFQDARPMSIDEVRRVVFRPQRRGYREWQVDLLLDGAIEAMLAVR